MRIAVTGSAGFIGTQLVKWLLARKHTVLGVDDLSLGQTAPEFHRAYEFEVLDVVDEPSLRSCFEAFRPERVVHLAAVHHIPTCESRPALAMRVNVVGTQVVLNVSREVGCDRIVLASSGAVYDWEDGELSVARSPVLPRDVYSISKVANEHQVRVWQQQQSATAVIARLFNTIGPGDLNGHLIPDILAQLRGCDGASRKVIRLGNTRPMRDYVYVGNVADALGRMVEVTLESGLHVFNVGTGTEFSVRDIVRGLADAMGVRCEVKSEAARMRPVDRLHQCADIDGTTAALGWRPTVSLEEALKRTVEAM